MSFALWITGLPGSGKSTVAKQLAKNIDAEILRLDNIRKAVTPKPKYSNEEKDLVYRALAYMGSLLVEKGINVIFDGTDEVGVGRETARKMIKNFGVISLECSVEVCEEREKKRTDKAGIHELYERARKGEIKLAGLNAPYAKEREPVVAINSEITGPEEASNIILKKLKEKKWIG